MPINDDYYLNYRDLNPLTAQQLDRLQRELMKPSSPYRDMLDRYNDMPEVSAAERRIEDLEFQVNELERALQMARREVKVAEERKEQERQRYLDEQTAHHLLKEKHEAALAVLAELSKETPEQISFDIAVSLKEKGEKRQSKIKGLLDEWVERKWDARPSTYKPNAYQWGLEQNSVYSADGWNTWNSPTANYTYDGTSLMRIAKDSRSE